jgi:hypothetical protein
MIKMMPNPEADYKNYKFYEEELLNFYVNHRKIFKLTDRGLSEIFGIIQ